LEFSNSPWNQAIPESQIGILARESAVYAAASENFDYECVLVEKDDCTTAYSNTPELGVVPGPAGVKFTLVFGNEYGTRKLFSHVPRPQEITHIELSKTLRSRATTECLERFKDVNPSFRKTVGTLLNLIKPYSFA
jgi:hypothetical protein